ncbi:MAG: hypothetical protein QGD94_00730, partial [Planctomycetia bacterium]|nr:hypothetical protein [Planctomycetia bacterium]
MRAERFLHLNFNRLKRRIKVFDSARALLWVLSSTLVGLLIIAAIDHAWPLGAGARRAAFLLLVVGAALAAARWLVVPLCRSISDTYVARLLEKEHPEFKNSLFTFVDFHADARRRGSIPD